MQVCVIEDDGQQSNGNDSISTAVQSIRLYNPVYYLSTLLTFVVMYLKTSNGPWLLYRTDSGHTIRLYTRMISDYRIHVQITPETGQ